MHKYCRHRRIFLGMKKLIFNIAATIVVAISLCGCTAVGEKNASLVIVYGAAAILALVLLVGYYLLVHKKEKWLLFLFSSVSVVNFGYYWLSVSSSLDSALMANRLSYLGSVFLPMSMMMVVLKVTKIEYKKWLPIFLFSLGIAVFLLAASGGILDVYYKQVWIEKVDGITVLNKVYGSLHPVYLVYLLSYFGGMVGTISYAISKKKLDSTVHSIILVFAVFVNTGVWLIEQLVQIEFEILSISYIISELFLLGLYMLLQESERQITLSKQVTSEQLSQLIKENEAKNSEEPEISLSDEFKVQRDLFVSGLDSLTNTERTVYGYYIEGKRSKEILSILDIKENTLKYHNKNIYGKLGVSSRKQLIEMSKILKTLDKTNKNG